MSKKLLVFLANGLEEIEAISSIDILRRAGLDVTTVTLSEKTVHGSHDIDIIADESIDNLVISDFDGIVFPGGLPGATNLRDDDRIIKIVQDFNKKDKLIAAICAAPMILDKAGILEGRKFTMHPGEEENVKHKSEGTRTMVDGNIITGIASGAAIEFAYRIVEKLLGKDKVEQVNKGVIARID